MLILTRQDIEKIVEIKDVIDAVEKAYLERAKQTAICPERLVIDIKKHKGSVLCMPAYLSKMDILATKIVTNYEENLSKYGLPTILGSIILNDSKTGSIISLIEGTYITALRTGATSGVAAKYLARKDSEVISVIGAGVQARTQVWALCQVLKNVNKVKAYDAVFERAEKFVKEISRMPLTIDAEIARSSRECVEDSDVVIIATTSRVPVLDGNWIKKGTHVTSIGYVGPDGREIDDATVKRSKIVVDTKSVLVESGDLIIPIRKGIITKDDVHAELAEIVSGEKLGRAEKDEITCFKSVGLAIGDAAVAGLVYKKAIKEKVGTEINL